MEFFCVAPAQYITRQYIHINKNSQATKKTNVPIGVIGYFIRRPQPFLLQPAINTEESFLLLQLDTSLHYNILWLHQPGNSQNANHHGLVRAKEMRPGMVLGISVFFSTSQYRKYRLSPLSAGCKKWGVKTLRQNIIIPLTISQNTPNTSALLLWEKISDQKNKNPRLRQKNKLLGWTDWKIGNQSRAKEATVGGGNMLARLLLAC